jgi:hypothetical protein
MVELKKFSNEVESVSVFKNIKIGEHAIVEITDPADAHDLIQQLKQQNDWK